MRIRPLVLVMTVSALALAGCTSPSAPPAASPSAAASSTPTPTPEGESRLVLSVDALAYEHDGMSNEVAFSDGDSLVDLIEGIAGEGVAEEFDGPYDSEGGTRYRWDGIVVSVYSYDTSAYVRVEGETVGGVGIETTEGLAVGGTRADALAAGAEEICSYDGDGDGATDVLALQATDVADTRSLCRTDRTGVQFVEVELAGDAVVSLTAPGNDFSDI